MAAAASEITSASPSEAMEACQLRDRYAELIFNPGHCNEARKRLRALILDKGLPEETAEERRAFREDGRCTLRGLVWKILLGIGKLDAESYIQLVERGPSDCSDKISGDTYRTFKSDDAFWQCVPELKLTRVLNAFVSSCSEWNARLSYVQGMNILVGPFLFVMPELDAYTCFHSMLHNLCPLYVYPNLDGARIGSQLMDECLEVLDLELYTYLRKKQLHAELYAFPSILTFSGCTPPLTELLRLWDFLFAYGVHMNVMCTIAQILMIRDKILLSPSPMLHLRTLPSIDSTKVIHMAVDLTHKLPERLYSRLARHPFEPMDRMDGLAEREETDGKPISQQQ